MTLGPDDIDDLAAAIADAQPIAWTALFARADTPADRARLARFQLLARVAGVHADAGAPSDHAAVALPDYRPGDQWGALRIVERLAAGTFGTVYRAHDPALARDVALKILNLPGSADGTAALEAVREGRLLARVRHPNVVTVYGADVRDGRVGVWMELVEGRTLEDELLVRGPLPASEVAAAGHVLAGALQAVHDAGLLHRDVKSQNVMRDARDGRLVLMDFSAGREQVDPAVLDAMLPATLAGSPLYLAPELLAGAAASPRSDVYSLGVMLFRLWTRRYPVEAATLADLDEAHRLQHRLRVRDVRPDTPEWLARALERALAPDPANRTLSARTLGLELAGGEGHSRRRWRWRGAAALLAVSLAAGAGVAAWRWRSPSHALSFAARDWVLIADFENRTGNPVFDDVLEQALTRELANSRHVNVVPRDRVEDALVLMRRPLEAPLDARTAREVSLRDGGIHAVLVGRLSRVGDTYTLTTDIVDPADGRIHRRIEHDIATAEDLLPRVREQALRVREALGEAMPSLRRSERLLAQVTTPSLEALQLYSRAATLLEGESWADRDDAVSRYEAADSLLAQAIAIDPGFASAWLLRARATAARNPRVAPYTPRSTNDQLAYAERALSLAGQVSIEERYFIEGVAARLRADLGPGRRLELLRAAQAFETLLQLVPDHYWALIELDPIYRRLRRLDDAERTALHAASLRPNSIRFAAAAAQVHLRRRDREATARVASRALANVPPELDRAGGTISPDLAQLRMWEARDAWLDTDVSRLAALLDRYERDPRMPANSAYRASMSGAMMGMGQFDRAHRFIDRYSPKSVAAFRHNMVDAYREAWDVLRPRLVAERRNFAYVHQNSFHYPWAGLTDVGEWLVRERRRRGVRMNWDVQQEFVAQLRVAQGRHAEALELFAPILEDDQVPRVRMHEMVAIARHGTGDRAGAIALLERFDAEPSIAVSPGWSTHVWLGSEVRLAEYYLEAGRRADAARVAAKVRAHLVLADDGHPFTARLAKLP